MIGAVNPRAGAKGLDLWSLLTTQSVTVYVIAAIDSTIVGAIIAGVFSLINTAVILATRSRRNETHSPNDDSVAGGEQRDRGRRPRLLDRVKQRPNPEPPKRPDNEPL